MRRKRLLCVCAALLLLLTVPVRAVEAPVLPETPEAWETPPIDPASPADDPADDPAAAPEAPDVPETPELPENPDVPESPEQPENPETAEIPDETEPAGELEQPTQGEQVPAEAAEAPLPEEFPVINVSVPASCRVVANPYRMEVNLNGETHTEQVVSETCAMTNYSEVPVSVSASAVGTVYGQGMMFAASPPAEETRRKELFLYIEFQNGLSGGAWSGRYTNAANQIAVATVPVEKPNVLELSSGETGFCRVFGAAATHPENPWSAEDDFRVTLTFTFTPLVAEAIDFQGMPEASDIPETPEPWETPAEPEFPVETAGTDETEWEDVLY